jgi:hypothetical protein
MLNPYTSNLGMADPLKKVYVTCQPINHLGLLLFACLATNVKYFILFLDSINGLR